jgi:perosamine synthetase
MKKIPWWQAKIGNKEYGLIKSVLKDNFPNEGRLAIEFENKLASLLKVKHVVVVTNGTSAMYLSLKALGIGFGDEVIVPDLTFIATANAVEMTGAKAVLVDINKDTLNIDINSIKKAITKKTKAIIPVHVSGRAADLTSIIKLAKKEKLFVIEDAAEAFMSKYKGKYLGTFGVTGCFSLSPAKTITTGQGGFIATDNSKVYRKLKMLKDQGRPKRGTGGDDIHYDLGFNFKFTDLQAALGLGQLSYLTKRIQRMRRNYKLYQKYLSGLKEVTLLKFDLEKGELPQWCDGLFEEKDKLNKYLQSKNIDCRPFWHPIHTQAYYKKSDKLFPISTICSKKAMWLPSAFTLRDSDIKEVCQNIIEFYGSKK